MQVFSYDASVSPDPAPVTATVSASGATLVAQVTPPTFSVSVKASGNPIQWVLSSILSPLVNLIVPAVTTVLNSVVSQKLSSVTLATVQPVPVNLTSSDAITVTPGGFSLTGGGGYATLTGTITVS